MKRLIKKSEFYTNNLMSIDELIIVYKNPTSSEINDTLKNSSYQSIRGVILDSGDWYIWDGNILHKDINNKIEDSVDINQFRFALEQDTWLIDFNGKYSIEQGYDLIIKYQDKLNQLCPIDSKPFEIYNDKDGKYTQLENKIPFDQILNHNNTNQQTSNEIIFDPNGNEIKECIYNNILYGAICDEDNIVVWNDPNITQSQCEKEIGMPVDALFTFSQGTYNIVFDDYLIDYAIDLIKCLSNYDLPSSPKNSTLIVSGIKKIDQQEFQTTFDELVQLEQEL